MKILLDQTTLLKEEILAVIESKKYESYIVKNHNDIKKFNTLSFDIIYLTRSNSNIAYLYNNKKFYPILIKISNDIEWTNDEIYVDAKVKNINDFLNDVFVTLLGEKISFNNLKPVNLLKASYIHKFEKLEIKTPIVNNSLNTYLPYVKIEAFYLGRYYPTEKGIDNLYIYSSRILKGKYSGKITDAFFKAMLDNFQKISNYNFDYIFYVPCREDKKDRFASLINNNGIYIKGNYGEIKGKTREEKVRIMTGVFGLKEGFDVRNKSILLIDDVCTTNATLTVITELLLSYGANKITWLAFGKTIHHNDTKIEYKCSCGYNATIRFNSKTGEWFLTCENYENCKKRLDKTIFKAKQLIYS